MSQGVSNSHRDIMAVEREGVSLSRDEELGPSFAESLEGLVDGLTDNVYTLIVLNSYVC